jgi:hypothetical protein
LLLLLLLLLLMLLLLLFETAFTNPSLGITEQMIASKWKKASAD